MFATNPCFVTELSVFCSTLESAQTHITYRHTRTLHGRKWGQQFQFDPICHQVTWTHKTTEQQKIFPKWKSSGFFPLPRADRLPLWDRDPEGSRHNLLDWFGRLLEQLKHMTISRNIIFNLMLDLLCWCICSRLRMPPHTTRVTPGGTLFFRNTHVDLEVTGFQDGPGVLEVLVDSECADLASQRVVFRYFAHRFFLPPPTSTFSPDNHLLLVLFWNHLFLLLFWSTLWTLFIYWVNNTKPNTQLVLFWSKTTSGGDSHLDLHFELRFLVDWCCSYSRFRGEKYICSMNVTKQFQNITHIQIILRKISIKDHIWNTNHGSASRNNKYQRRDQTWQKHLILNSSFNEINGTAQQCQFHQTCHQLTWNSQKP